MTYILSMINKNNFIKLSCCAALIISTYFVIVWVNADLSTPAAIKIATNNSLSPEEQFIAMASLAYKDKQDPQALYLLYSMLYHGHGSPTSPETALFMLEKSANAGFAPAQEELAFIYLHGNKHYTKDVYLANYWLKKSARSGMNKSYYHLNN